MMERLKPVGIFVLLFVPLVLMFQNCGNKGVVAPGSMSESKFIYFSKRDPVERSVSSCFTGASYHCRINRYAPDLDDTRLTRIICVTVEEHEVCTELDEWHYDSSHALSLCPDCRAEDGRPGGQYNYSEVTCSFGNEDSSYLRLDESEAKAEEYLGLAVELCLAGLNM
ncbi:MAG: hypothetical protein KDD35_03220 [Bdellovibrionales bacterium]|nr:hypothetical protein [Bdellovibrionales bacterium]